ncbi:AtpZ/AtpI family protein [Flavobacterium sp. RNTU_13]|uniref:AtpZ/AtpI family protein n=1 Tax=Flavobacterium sp. RNTU_13 TaxID=3375145 RepID=UPI003987454F
MTSNPQDNNKKPNPWLALISIPTQMGLIIFLFSKLGSWLDEKYPNPNGLYFIICTMAGVAVALYNVVRQVNKLNK